MNPEPPQPDRQPARALSAADLGVPQMFNAATHFVDRNVESGRGSHVAIEHGDTRITYDEVQR